MARVQRLGRVEFGRKPDAASTEPHQPMWAKAADCCAIYVCKACALRAFLLPLRAKKKDVPHARLT